MAIQATSRVGSNGIIVYKGIDSDCSTGLCHGEGSQLASLGLRARVRGGDLRFFTAPTIRESERIQRDSVERHRNDDGILIAVTDNGIGFDMSHHEKIFEMFQRLHGTDEFPGTGIGLAIFRKAVERMGGRVWASSKPKEGATFYLLLAAA
ncbi:MAG TPA: ATP-binding protein [Steroidobacteraceae bacterium]|nr:ATP-binding protein [Steroidobacteraceae bacterium]